MLRLLALLGKIPGLRRWLAHRSYERMASGLRSPKWTFMNFGFVPPDGDAPALEPRDEPDRLSIQLYHRVASAIDLRSRRVLEIGSGRGGGAAFLARYHGPAHVTGADFSAHAVALSRAFHAGVPNLDFAEGDAERLPFPDASFDAVVNVESSHCYGSMDRFLHEVGRVLRPGGCFLFADFRAAAEVPDLMRTLDAQPGWQRVDHEDITAAVVTALEAGDAHKRKLIADIVRRPRVRKGAGEFAGLVGSRIHDAFRRREMVYVRAAYRRA